MNNMIKITILRDELKKLKYTARTIHEEERIQKSSLKFFLKGKICII